MWQDLRAELRPRGLEIVTVALDTGGVAAAGSWIDRARPEHPSLIDEAHVLDELLGIVNVPSGVWVDEHGTIVRPPETAYPGEPRMRNRPLGEDAPQRLKEIVAEASRIRTDGDRYLAALRDWVEHGSSSRYALDPEEVVARSAPRSPDASQAAAAFELAQHLHRGGFPDDAIPWFREAHRRQPENWTYRRQAWSLDDPLQGPSDKFESDWLTEIRRVGAERYYAPLDLDERPDAAPDVLEVRERD